MSELELLQSIYDILISFQPFVNLITGFIQVLIVVAVLYILYKLFNLFF